MLKVILQNSASVSVSHYCSVDCLYGSIEQSREIAIEASSDALSDASCDKCGTSLKNNIQPFLYFNQCDRWRTRYEKGEEHWQEMMANKKPLSLDAFLLLADPSELLDEGETVSEFVADDPEHGFYISKANQQTLLFLYHAGFEFIFTHDGGAP